MKKHVWKRITSLGLSLILATGAVATAGFTAAQPVSAASSGRWMVGEYHFHTTQSADSRNNIYLADIFERAFLEYSMDYLMVAEHLRMSDRDLQGVSITPLRLSQAIELYQQPEMERLLSTNEYGDKLGFIGAEWDMPGFDHGALGILPDAYDSLIDLEAFQEFEYLFAAEHRIPASAFTPEEMERWGERRNATKAQTESAGGKAYTYDALAWLAENYPDSYVLLNHPSRQNGKSYETSIEDLRTMNDIAPNIVFGMEGMLGNQMSPDEHRGEIKDSYGGVDVVAARLGGVWDALLGEGRHFWNFANSDFHFKIDSNGNSSGYWPGEYSKNYTWVEGNGIHAVVDGLRSGNSFSVHGDLINALDFRLENHSDSASMGSHLGARQQDEVTVTIRFRSPETNHYEPVGNYSDPSVTNQVKVNHVDLITGEVTGKISPADAEAYANPTNPTTRVEARFFTDELEIDDDGYYVVHYPFIADTDRYFRLRGTNLEVDVDGIMVNGEPQQDESIAKNRPETHDQINDRNYSNMWFYSNPIFLDVEPYTEEMMVADMITALPGQLGDLSAVESSIQLPLKGLNETTIKWSSDSSYLSIPVHGTESQMEASAPDSITVSVTRPTAATGDVTASLTAEISKNETSGTAEFTVGIKAQDTVKRNSSSSSGSRPTNEVTPEKVPDPDTDPETTPEPTLSAGKFSDMTNHWGYDAVDWAVKQGLFSGVSEIQFDPDSAMTRAMFVAVLHRYAGEPRHTGTDFSDISSNAYYYHAVQWATATDVVSGIGDQQFAPDSPITREQLAVILYQHKNPSPVTCDLGGFSDSGEISNWASEAVQWAVDASLLQGQGNGRLAPKSNATRAEAAAILMRYAQLS